MSVLDVRRLSIGFGGIKAVQDLSFAVAPGAIHALIGPNGAGKTTVLNCISRFYQPDGGEILVGGRDLLRLADHQIAALGVARTFQNLELFKEMTVEHNVFVARHRAMRVDILSTVLRLAGARAEEARERAAVARILERVGLAGLAGAEAGSLPYGQQKLVELARAMALEPKLLLLDEPAAGMNAREVADLGGLLKRLRAELDTTILLIEHNMGLVMSVADRITVMNHGKFLAEGTPKEIEGNEAVIAAYLGGGKRGKRRTAAVH